MVSTRMCSRLPGDSNPTKLPWSETQIVILFGPVPNVSWLSQVVDACEGELKASRQLRTASGSIFQSKVVYMVPSWERTTKAECEDVEPVTTTFHLMVRSGLLMGISSQGVLRSESVGNCSSERRIFDRILRLGLAQRQGKISLECCEYLGRAEPSKFAMRRPADPSTPIRGLEVNL